ncbi:MAG: protein translocase subunit SecF [Chloroflexi bacterium]|nr:protein translocase subunit SecF [Chloroflexota bacterium]
MDIIGKRYWFFGLSLLIIIPGLIALGLGGMKPGIDFTGGSLIEIQFDSGAAPEPQAVRQAVQAVVGEDVTVQSSGASGVLIKLKPIDEATQQEILASLTKDYGAVTVLQFESVGPAVGNEVAQRAAGAVALASIAIALYVTYAFRRVPNAFRFGVAAITSLVHDVLVLLGLEALLGLFLGWEADALFLTAVLTVIGFSVHDTIVVFDRIRENQTLHRRIPFETVVNHSIVQTLDRSINTTLTVLLTLFALALFGGATTRHFIVILLIGMFSGTYSSVFNAAAILVVWENRDWQRWFRRRPAQSSPS